MGAQQPFLYEREKFDSTRFPTSTFDPKAVTRASWEPKPRKPQQDGPLVSFNQHPDAHELLGPRSNFKTMGRRTKDWIVRARIIQLAMRVLQLNGAIGLLVLMILITNVDNVTAWVLRITSGIVAISCTYASFHLSRPAGQKPPGSSASYHLFAAFCDLCVLPLYAFGMLSVRKHSESWKTMLADENIMEYFVPAVYYDLLGSGALHVLTLAISLWLGLKFHQITQIPPDMNPLEDHLTARPKHKRNKSSVATCSTTTSEGEKRLSTPLEDHRRSGVPYQSISRPPSIPFMHTRQESDTSLLSSAKRDSRADLPSRQYQIMPGNSPRSSRASVDLRRMSTASFAPPPTPPHRASYRGGVYTEIPLPASSASSFAPSRPSSRSPAAGTPTSATFQKEQQSPTRPAKFTEAWYASESLISRTQQRNRAMNTAAAAAAAAGSDQKQSRQDGGSYEALSQRYDMPELDSEPEDEENIHIFPDPDEDDEEDPEEEREWDGKGLHPSPLRSNPVPRRPNTPYRRPESAGALSEVSVNSRSVSGNGDIADALRISSNLQGSPDPTAMARNLDNRVKSAATKRQTWAPSGGGGGVSRPLTPGGPQSHYQQHQPEQPRTRDSSIQLDTGFYSKPYGELKPATPPVMVGSNRQTSSGNDLDFDLGSGAGRLNSTFGRRNVSGKVAEEGRAGGAGYSSYGMFNS